MDSTSKGQAWVDLGVDAPRYRAPACEIKMLACYSSTRVQN